MMNLNEQKNHSSQLYLQSNTNQSSNVNDISFKSEQDNDNQSQRDNLSSLPWDHKISRAIYDYSAVQTNSLARFSCYFLEFSAHGLVWLTITIAYILQTEASLNSYEFLRATIFLIGLFTDLLILAGTKIFVRRSRPVYNPGLQVGTINVVDQFSFPSGHATRSVYVAAYTSYMIATLDKAIWSPSEYFVFSLVWVWALAISWSRIALGRHYFVDVCAGILVGLFNATVLLSLPIDRSILLHWRALWLQLIKQATS